MLKDIVLRPVIWIGDSKKQLKKMPEDVQKQLGGELYLAQRGEKPPHGKPFKGIGSGVFEIKDDFDSDTIALYMPYKLEYGSMSCMCFRRKARRVLPQRKKMWI